MQLTNLSTKTRIEMIKTFRLKLTLNLKTVVKRKMIREKITSVNETNAEINSKSALINKTYNFYMKIIVQSFKSNKKKYEVRKTLIDEENNLNLISQRMIKKMKFNVIKNDFTVIKIANED